VSLRERGHPPTGLWYNVPMDDLPDIVYVVKPGERNNALRYSLRSLANLPHRRVIIGGSCPTWVKNVTHVPVPRLSRSKFDSIEANLKGALRAVDVSEQCVYFNDDFYVMTPLERMPILHGGPAAEYHPTEQMGRRLRKTLAELRFYADVLTYDGVHVPLPIIRDAVLGALEHAPGGILWRTWYGNMCSIGGERTHNAKVRHARGMIPDGPFLSSSPMSLASLKEFIEDILPKRSPYV
jgi:hypothetical protein